jgi:hypothetical protein
MKNSNIFKFPIPSSILYNILNQTSKIEKGYFYIDYTSYKKMNYYNLMVTFCETIQDYYHLSKQHYCNKTEMTYNRFITILRQICNANKIEFFSITKYDKDKVKQQSYYCKDVSL